MYVFVLGVVYDSDDVAECPGRHGFVGGIKIQPIKDYFWKISCVHFDFYLAFICMSTAYF